MLLVADVSAAAKSILVGDDDNDEIFDDDFYTSNTKFSNFFFKNLFCFDFSFI